MPYATHLNYERKKWDSELRITKYNSFFVKLSVLIPMQMRFSYLKWFHIFVRILNVKKCFVFVISKSIFSSMFWMRWIIQFSNFLLSGCTCNAGGSENAACDTAGKCTCKANVIGRDCDSCEEGYYGFPDCQGKVN